MTTFYVILEVYLPQSKTAVGFKVEAEDMRDVLTQIHNLNMLHNKMIGLMPDLVEVSTKKRRGVEYV